MSDHLDYESTTLQATSGEHAQRETRNNLKGAFDELDLETPRNRKATFDPKIVAKGQTRWSGFCDKIISMYSLGTEPSRALVEHGPAVREVRSEHVRRE